MLHKYAELDIYEDFINGNLNPVKLQGEHLTTISKYLNDQEPNCQDMILGKFKTKGNQKRLIEKVKISTIHPLAPEYFYQKQIFSEQNNDIIAADILEQLKVQPECGHNIVKIKHQNSIQMIGVAFQSEWEELQPDRIKYGYINQILDETVCKTKSNLRAHIFSLQEKEAKNTLDSVQRLLISYINDVLQQFDLNESDLEIKVKPAYSNNDCAALIYLSIVDIMNFMDRHFYKLLDHQQRMPYFSNIANHNDFVGTAKQILKILKKIEIDDALYSIIEEKLEKVLNLDLNSRITYKEVNYFSTFLSAFLRFLKKNKYYQITEEAVIHFMIAHNFNDFIFYEYLINKMRVELLDCENTHEMSMTLIRKQTELRQISRATKKQLVDDRKDLLTMLLEWIRIEEEYVKQLEKEPGNTTIQSFPKLTTTMSAAELALLFKLLHNKDHVNPETKTEMMRWIQQSFRNEKSESISIQHIRNNMYNHSDKTVENVKSIGIDLLNEIKLI